MSKQVESKNTPVDEEAALDTSAESAEAAASKESPPDSVSESVNKPADGVAELQRQIADLEDLLLRAKAECQNIRRRAGVEKAQAIRFANAELMKSLLNVADDFDRALAAATETKDMSSVVEGIRLVHDNFTKALREHGLEQVEGQGKAFDPVVHEAVAQQPSSQYPEGTVLREIAKGYRLRDRVLRPAKVIVSKAPLPDGSTNDKASDEANKKENSASQSAS